MITQSGSHDSEGLVDTGDGNGSKTCLGSCSSHPTQNSAFVCVCTCFILIAKEERAGFDGNGGGLVRRMEKAEMRNGEVKKRSEKEGNDTEEEESRSSGGEK